MSFHLRGVLNAENLASRWHLYFYLFFKTCKYPLLLQLNDIGHIDNHVKANDNKELRKKCHVVIKNNILCTNLFHCFEGTNLITIGLN